MTTLVHTLRYGNEPWLAECAATLEAWCDRHDYELVIWSNNRGYSVPKLVEFDAMNLTLMPTMFKRMIYIDADVWIHPEAPAFPELTGLAMATDHEHQLHHPHFHQWCEDHYGESFPEWIYSNAGVWSMDSSVMANFVNLDYTTDFHEFFQEQHYFNYLAALLCDHSNPSRCQFSRLPSEWNRWGRDHQPAWFWHLWGDQKMADLATVKRIYQDLTPSCQTKTN
jgi:hypothetical protein